MAKLADYQIRITDPTTGFITRYIILTESYGLKFDRIINDIGKFVLTLNYSDKLYNAFCLDSIVDIQRTNPNGDLVTEATYMTRNRIRMADESDERLVVSGWHINHLLKRRYIDPDDDSTQPNGGYATKAGNAGNIIRAYIREQAGDLASSDRQTIGLTVPSPTDIGSGSGGNFRFENLWSSMIPIAETSQLHIEIRHNGNRDFEVFIGKMGTDKTIDSQTTSPFNFGIFSPDFGNLSEPEYEEDRMKEITVVTVKGSGSRNSQNSLMLTSPALTDTPYNRIEKTADARNTNEGNTQLLYTTGLEALRKNRADFIFSGVPLLTSGGAVYRTDWELGDIITIQWGSIQKDLQIRGITFEVEENNETIQTALSEQ